MKLSAIATNNTVDKNFPKRFVMYLYIVTVVMIFAGFTSAMIVSMRDNIANNSWKNFEMPTTFLITTFVVILSSGTLFWAQRSAKRNHFAQLNLGLWLTLLLGIVFLTGQYIGFTELDAQGIKFVDNAQSIGKTPVYNVSGSFFMILTGMHALHIVAGLLVLLVMIVKALLFRINKEKSFGLQLYAIFWHSLGLIWIYLYIFLSSVYS